MLPSKQVPISSLSIQSFHDDSPPFTGAGDTAPFPPAFDLASTASPALHAVLGSSVPPSPFPAGSARLTPAPGQPPPPSRPQPPSRLSTVSAGLAGLTGLAPPGAAITPAAAPATTAPSPAQRDDAAGSSSDRPSSRASSSSSAAASSSGPPSDAPNPPAAPHLAAPNPSPPPAPPRTRSTSAGEIRHAADGEADKELALSDGPARDIDTGRYLAGDEPYTFPRHRLRDVWEDESKTPLVIVACGSFSPPTYLHLRMFEMAKDQIEEDGRYEILGGYYSPVSDHYKKAGLAPAPDRVKMCELGVETTSMWLMVDPWEAGQDSYQRTAVVLQHFEREINGGDQGGVYSKSGKHTNVKIMLLAGGDLIESFGHPGVWAEDDLHIILGHFGCLIIERTGSDVWAFLLSHDILHFYRRNIIVVKQLIYNDISSTKVRLFVRRGMSIKYLLPNSVISYILERGLYRSVTAPYSLPLEITPTTTPAPPHNLPSPSPDAAGADPQFFPGGEPTSATAAVASVDDVTGPETPTAGGGPGAGER